MKLYLKGHNDRYAVEQLQLSLFPEESMEPEQAPFSGDGAVSALYRGKTWLTAVTAITQRGVTHRAVRRLPVKEETVRLRRRILQQSYYLAALPFLPEKPAWGALAGVRPTKITTRHLIEGGTEQSADRLMRDVYYVTEDRRKLAIDCSVATVAAGALLDPADISLYVGIPFCPTRCAYCSFVSRSIGKSVYLMEDYLSALERELRLTGKLLETSGRKVRTLYIGGGTPTTLTSAQLGWLLGTLKEVFDLSRCMELTVEGGRPDTLDEEKLQTIHACGANRMSINPQSMVDSVLRACGRPHTAGDVERGFCQARKAGYDAINMDLIAGLPTDTFEGFRYSLDTVAAFRPENITVHTLALKKGADLFSHRESLPPQQAVAEMVAYAERTLRDLGYRPYYLYRQKYMSGSFENVGWSRDGHPCLYNIYMMEELHSIVSVGGGGMSKVNLPGGTLERFPNPKFPEQYTGQIENVLRQKRELFERMKG